MVRGVKLKGLVIWYVLKGGPGDPKGDPLWNSAVGFGRFIKNFFTSNLLFLHPCVDLYCQQNFDPNKKKDLDNVNTEICEQLFVRVNQHRNCKAMNEARRNNGKKAKS